MLSEIWEPIREAFTFIYNRILRFIIEPVCITFFMLSLYLFISCLIHHEILLGFGILFVAILFLKLLEGGK